MDYYYGIDMGTTHIKTGVVTEEQEIIALYKTDTPLAKQGGHDVYLPKDLMTILLEQMEQAGKDYPHPKGIAITGMAEAGLVIDRNSFQELTPIIPWFDKRTLELASKMSKEEELARFQVTGLRNSFKYGIYKYLWCIEHYQLKREETIWLSICDYIFYQLTNYLATEPTFAARTYAYDIQQKCWDTAFINKMGLLVENFPQVLESGKGSANRLGTKIPVALCGHDHICSAFELIHHKGEICNSCGTAETYIGIMEEVPSGVEGMESGMVYGPYVDGIHYFGMANLSSSGQAVEWIRKQIQNKEITYQQINEILTKVKKVPGDILFMPYLSGMGSPLFNAECSGAMLFLKAEHTITDIIQGVVEGICYQSRWILNGFDDQKVEKIIATGGSTASDFWMQCKANVLNKPVAVSTVEEGTLTGAVSLFLFKNEKRKRTISENIKKEYYPVKTRASAYEIRYQKDYLPAAQFISGLVPQKIGEYNE